MRMLSEHRTIHIYPTSTPCPSHRCLFDPLTARLPLQTGPHPIDTQCLQREACHSRSKRGLQRPCKYSAPQGKCAKGWVQTYQRVMRMRQKEEGDTYTSGVLCKEYGASEACGHIHTTGGSQ